ncbi:hypothetical protein COD75_15025 [Bacillus anthracis]|nr:hypothetical protein CN518_16065 [Bacillus anthracis]PFA52643.1 hypothetical protein CN391_07905 [Bacillus anthracis]PGV35902.1 hypothetical protein COD75_15025 [Bacillus anthracis]
MIYSTIETASEISIYEDNTSKYPISLGFWDK